MRSLSILLIAILLCSCRGSRVTEFPQNEDQVKQDEVKSEVRVGNSASAIASELNARWRQLLETNPSELLPWVEYVIAYSRQQDSEADHLAGVWEKIADRFPNDSDVLRQTARASNGWAKLSSSGSGKGRKSKAA